MSSAAKFFGRVHFENLSSLRYGTRLLGDGSTPGCPCGTLPDESHSAPFYLRIIEDDKW
jgi:hypothetical protein